MRGSEREAGILGPRPGEAEFRPQEIPALLWPPILPKILRKPSALWQATTFKTKQPTKQTTMKTVISLPLPSYPRNFFFLYQNHEPSWQEKRVIFCSCLMHGKARLTSALGSIFTRHAPLQWVLMSVFWVSTLTTHWKPFHSMLGDMGWSKMAGMVAHDTNMGMVEGRLCSFAQWVCSLLSETVLFGYFDPRE